RGRLRRKVVRDDRAAPQEDGPGDAEDCSCHSLDATRCRGIQPVALSLRERIARCPLAEREGYRTTDYSLALSRPKARWYSAVITWRRSFQYGVRARRSISSLVRSTSCGEAWAKFTRAWRNSGSSRSTHKG